MTDLPTLDGVAAPPRTNGELVFAAPWEARAFGMALALVERLGVDWEDFRQRLVTAIGEDPDRPYYESWAVALEALVVDHGLATAADVDERAAAVTT